MLYNNVAFCSVYEVLKELESRYLGTLQGAWYVACIASLLPLFKSQIHNLRSTSSVNKSHHKTRRPALPAFDAQTGP